MLMTLPEILPGHYTGADAGIGTALWCSTKGGGDDEEETLAPRPEKPVGWQLTGITQLVVATAPKRLLSYTVY